MKIFENVISKIEDGIDYISLTPSYDYITYLRVSQSGGSFRRQEKTISDFCRVKNIIVDEWFKETCSGVATSKERKVFKEVFDYCYENNKTIVLIDSTDRFCRSKKTACELIRLLQLTDAKLYFIREGLLVYPKKQKNTNRLIDYVSVANQELVMYRHRMNSGYKAYRSSGGKVGRKVGYRKSDVEMKTQYQKEIELLSEGYSLRRIYAITDTSVNTLRKLKKKFVNV